MALLLALLLLCWQELRLRWLRWLRTIVRVVPVLCQAFDGRAGAAGPAPEYPRVHKSVHLVRPEKTRDSPMSR